MTSPGIERFIQDGGVLDTREARDRAQCFWVEGARFVTRALQTRAKVVVVLLSKSYRPGPGLEKLLKRFSALGGRVCTVSETKLSRWSRASEPQGCAAVVQQWWDPLPAKAGHKKTLWLGFDQVRSFGNLGAVFRTATAAGCAGAIFLGDATDPYDPRCVRATMGAIFHLRLIRASADALARWRRRSGYTIVGTSAHASCDYRNQDFKRPVLLMVGCERGGLSQSQRALCERTVKIPMCSGVDSLNLAAATSLVLYEAFHQRSPPRKRALR